MLKSTVIQRHKSAPNKTLKLQSAGAAYWNTNTWGESNSINTARVQKNTYQIELQSGDTLQLEATTFGFDTIGSYPQLTRSQRSLKRVHARRLRPHVSLVCTHYLKVRC